VSQALALQISPDFVRAISDGVIERLKPWFTIQAKPDEDIIFDVPGLSEYLKVEASWVYDAAKMQKIPHYKMGKYLRFRKAAIDAWLEKQSIRPLSAVGRKKEG